MRASITAATLGWLGCVLVAAPRTAWAFAPDGGRRSLRPSPAAPFPRARRVGAGWRGPPFVARGAARSAVADSGDATTNTDSVAPAASSSSSAAVPPPADAARLALDEAVGAADRWAGAQLLAKVFDESKPFDFLAVLCWPGILPNVFFEVGDGGDGGAAQSVWLARDADTAAGDDGSGAAGDVIGVVQLVPAVPRAPTGDETQRNVVWMQASACWLFSLARAPATRSAVFRGTGGGAERLMRVVVACASAAVRNGGGGYWCGGGRTSRSTRRSGGAASAPRSCGAPRRSPWWRTLARAPPPPCDTCVWLRARRGIATPRIGGRPWPRSASARRWERSPRAKARGSLATRYPVQKKRINQMMKTSFRFDSIFDDLICVGADELWLAVDKSNDAALAMCVSCSERTAVIVVSRSLPPGETVTPSTAVEQSVTRSATRRGRIRNNLFALSRK